MVDIPDPFFAIDLERQEIAELRARIDTLESQLTYVMESTAFLISIERHRVEKQRKK